MTDLSAYSIDELIGLLERAETEYRESLDAVRKTKKVHFDALCKVTKVSNMLQVKRALS